MRFLLSALLIAALAGCVSDGAPTGQGPGFESYADYQRRREAELAAAERARMAGLPQRPAVVAPGAPSHATPGGRAQPPIPAAPAAVASRPQATPPAPVIGAPLSATQPAQTAAAPDPANPAISDEQNFEAVAARESIESDRARIDANREQYTEVAPTAVPERPSGSKTSIVDYALSATNRLGQSVYRRSRTALTSHARACAAFASPDLAQETFLARGGPRRDPRNLDPDGDGFACTWDPTPFQKARGG